VPTGDRRNRVRRLGGANHTDDQEHHHIRQRQQSHSSHTPPFRSTTLGPVFKGIGCAGSLA
jgi:hypothetical protein